jgi:hypothetical protein
MVQGYRRGPDRGSVGVATGWTKIFKRADLTGNEPDFVVRLLDAIAKILEGSQEEETLREIRAQLKEVLQCEDISLFFLSDERPRPEEGEWILKVKAGFGEGNKVTQADARAVPSLVSGKRLVASEFLTEKAVLKTIALAFEEDTFYGCDIENKKVVLLKNPTPEDDLGSGDLSVLAIPLRHQAKVGRVVEKSRVGVLVLYKTPTQRDLGALEQPLRSLLAHAVVAPRCQLRDPVTSLFTEAFLREELGRQMNLYELTGGKLMGGFVAGHIDTLHLYKQTLESAANVDPAEISQRVSDVLRGISTCVLRRATDHVLGAGVDFRCGYAGRVTHDGFGVILPRMTPFELCMWANRLEKEVIDFPFAGEELLPRGEVTVTLRVIPFGAHAAHTADAVWKLGKDALDEVTKTQIKLRADPEALKGAVGTILVLSHDGRWIPPSEISHDATAEATKAAPKAAPVVEKIDGLDFVDMSPDASAGPGLKKPPAPPPAKPSLKAAAPPPAAGGRRLAPPKKPKGESRTLPRPKKK